MTERSWGFKSPLAHHLQSKIETTPRPSRRGVVVRTHNLANGVITGELFFASANELVHEFDLSDPTPNVVIDLSGAELHDRLSGQLIEPHG